MAFQLNHAAPGVTHIQDCMGVCMTLIEGTDRALLVDAGYGVEDVSALLKERIGDKPVQILLTHHHHDHVLGLRTLSGLPAAMFPADLPAFDGYTDLAHRQHVLDQARARGVPVAEDAFLHGAIAAPKAARPGDMSLGSLTVRVIPCPSHTPGSAAVLIVERRILLTGDCWNPCTWAFFPEALPVRQFRRSLQALQTCDFAYVLCSHQLKLYPRAAFDAFVDGLTDDLLRAALPVDVPPYEAVDTRQAVPAEGQLLVFDWAKAAL